MTDAFKQLVADEKGKVVLNAEHEVRYWTGHLGVDEPCLRAAIGAVGNNAHDVRRYLADNGRARVATPRADVDPRRPAVPDAG